ncbi:metabotropic glutamate receptor 4 isoform X3 [Hyposmocoma kahamanoa]|uniref:metabotropic glutamate receptor 4 isoform X3 n=2 Tax=Hyposmocoma kahamanoa TaxID=1477025 RepID=UPI000E6D8428|nr:metabotropic glutamate receptor 4 isoform X3 [Hyposmocoma kahamanoa]
MASRALHSLLASVALVSLAGAARFGDRLAPRVPAAYGPRNAHGRAVPHLADSHYEDSYEQDDYNEQIAGIEELLPETEPPPRRPARTEAHRLEMSTEYFVVPQRSSSSPAPPTSSRPSYTTPRPRPINTTTIATPITGALRSESWAVPILALACVSMVTIGGFEAFVVWGASKRSPSQRHLLLGQTLLFGLFTSAATAALYAATPTVFTCGAVRFGTGVSYVVVFASLLVKCVFLLSLNGGVYLPATYQGLLLFFAVMIQVAIGAQWLGGSPPRVATGGARCEGALSELLLSLCYAAFLVTVVCGVALRSRGIRDNYREATHIAGAGGATAAVWVCWVAAALGAPERHRDACIAAGLLATTSVVFALMFAPKGRRLAALGREGRWDADRDEGLSSLGAGGSGYSPSFFHFKPVKYGMVSAVAPGPAAVALDRKEPPAQPAGVMVRGEEGNVYTSVEPTFSSNPNVYFQRPEPLHVGMMY